MSRGPDRARVDTVQRTFTGRWALHLKELNNTLLATEERTLFELGTKTNFFAPYTFSCHVYAGHHLLIIRDEKKGECILKLVEDKYWSEFIHALINNLLDYYAATLTSDDDWQKHHAISEKCTPQPKGFADLCDQVVRHRHVFYIRRKETFERVFHRGLPPPEYWTDYLRMATSAFKNGGTWKKRICAVSVDNGQEKESQEYDVTLDEVKRLYSKRNPRGEYVHSECLFDDGFFMYKIEDEPAVEESSKQEAEANGSDDISSRRRGQSFNSEADPSTSSSSSQEDQLVQPAAISRKASTASAESASSGSPRKRGRPPRQEGSPEKSSQSSGEESLRRQRARLAEQQPAITAAVVPSTSTESAEPKTPESQAPNSETPSVFPTPSPTTQSSSSTPTPADSPQGSSSSNLPGEEKKSESSIADVPGKVETAQVEQPKQEGVCDEHAPAVICTTPPKPSKSPKEEPEIVTLDDDDEPLPQSTSMSSSNERHRPFPNREQPSPRLNSSQQSPTVRSIYLPNGIVAETAKSRMYPANSSNSNGALIATRQPTQFNRTVVQPMERTSFRIPEGVVGMTSAQFRASREAAAQKRAQQVQRAVGSSHSSIGISPEVRTSFENGTRRLMPSTPEGFPRAMGTMMKPIVHDGNIALPPPGRPTDSSTVKRSNVDIVTLDSPPPPPPRLSPNMPIVERPRLPGTPSPVVPRPAYQFFDHDIPCSSRSFLRPTSSPPRVGRPVGCRSGYRTDRNSLAYIERRNKKARMMADQMKMQGLQPPPIEELAEQIEYGRKNLYQPQPFYQSFLQQSEPQVSPIPINGLGEEKMRRKRNDRDLKLPPLVERPLFSDDQIVYLRPTHWITKKRYMRETIAYKGMPMCDYLKLCPGADLISEEERLAVEEMGYLAFYEAYRKCFNEKLFPMDSEAAKKKAIEEKEKAAKKAAAAKQKAKEAMWEAGRVSDDVDDGNQQAMQVQSAFDLIEAGYRSFPEYRNVDQKGKKHYIEFYENFKEFKPPLCMETLKACLVDPTVNGKLTKGPKPYAMLSIPSGLMVPILDGKHEMRVALPVHRNWKMLYPGTIVWGKFGSDSWPGNVAGFIPYEVLGNGTGGDVVVVKWFNDFRRSFIHYSHVSHFDLNFHINYQRNNRKDDYCRAVAEAIVSLGRIGYWEHCVNSIVGEYLRQLKMPAVCMTGERYVEIMKKSDSNVIYPKIPPSQKLAMTQYVERELLLHFQREFCIDIESEDIRKNRESRSLKEIDYDECLEILTGDKKEKTASKPRDGDSGKKGSQVEKVSRKRKPSDADYGTRASLSKVKKEDPDGFPTRKARGRPLKT